MAPLVRILLNDLTIQSFFPPRCRDVSGFLAKCASCFLPHAREPVFSGSLSAVSERIGYVCVLYFMCCFWLPAYSRLKKKKESQTFCLRWLLFRISDVGRSKINVQSWKNLFNHWNALIVYLIHSTCFIASLCLLEYEIIFSVISW